MWTMTIKLRDGHRITYNEIRIQDCIAKLNAFIEEDGQALIVAIKLKQSLRG